jgi:hypothetical protein
MIRKITVLGLLLIGLGLWGCGRAAIEQDSPTATLPTANAEPLAKATPKPSPNGLENTVPVMSVNAYKVPYLGLDGAFYLNQGNKAGYADARSPKRVVISKMQTFSFYSDAAGKRPIAKNCAYTYLGAAKDPKFYADFKGAVWDLFELEVDEKGDPNCQKFKHLTVVPPHGEPTHMHIRYSNDKTDAQGLLNMSQAEKPWFPTYCGIGKTVCNEPG